MLLFVCLIDNKSARITSSRRVDTQLALTLNTSRWVQWFAAGREQHFIRTAAPANEANDLSASD
jgi:hypothetical protein